MWLSKLTCSIWPWWVDWAVKIQLNQFSCCSSIFFPVCLQCHRWFILSINISVLIQTCWTKCWLLWQRTDLTQAPKKMEETWVYKQRNRKKYLTITSLWANSADNKLVTFFFSVPCLLGVKRGTWYSAFPGAWFRVCSRYFVSATSPTV